MATTLRLRRSTGGATVRGGYTLRGSESLAAVGKNLDLRWAVHSVVRGDLDLRWEVSDLLQVSKDLDLRWEVLNVLGKNLDLRWEVVGVAAAAPGSAELVITHDSARIVLTSEMA